jgi:hypothetical protein
MKFLIEKASEIGRHGPRRPKPVVRQFDTLEDLLKFVQVEVHESCILEPPDVDTDWPWSILIYDDSIE